MCSSDLASCPDLPPAGCRQAGRSRLVLRAGRRTDRVKYAWRHGAATSRTDLGDPIGGANDFALCIYDVPDGVATFDLDLHAPSEASCPSGPRRCWSEAGRGLVYTDKTGSPGGLRSLLLRPGDSGEAGLRARAAGELFLPALPLHPPVTAAVVGSDGLCWSSVFASDDVRRNEGAAATGAFVARQQAHPERACRSEPPASTV